MPTEERVACLDNDGTSPEEFTSRVRAFMSRAEHPTLARPLLRNVHLPMLELIDELRRRDAAARFSLQATQGATGRCWNGRRPARDPPPPC